MQKSELLKVMGVRGLSVFSGVLREEYLTDLRDWHKAARIYREMADDITVGTLLDSIIMPLLAADFDVPPISEAPGDVAARDFLWEAMNSMDHQTWRSHVVDALECLTFGFSFAEVIMEKRDDGRLWLKNLDPRGQETLQRWEWEEDHPVAFIQRDPVTGKMYSIPVAKAVHVTFRGRKGNPQGKPILRSLFRSWLKLKYLENFEALGIERDVGGMPVVDFPDPEKWQGPTEASQLKEIFQETFENLRMAENMWLLVPPGARAQSWGSGPRSYNVREAIVAKQKEVLMRFFAQFLYLGMEQVGTQALVKGSQDFFSLALKAVQQEILEAWNLQLVPLIFEFNSFPGMTELPQITWNDPGKVDVDALLQAYGQGVTSKVLTPLRQDEEHVRALMDLPDLPEGEGMGPRETTPSMFPFSEHPAGQRLRVAPDKFDSFLNAYQRELVETFDPWIEETQRLMIRATGDGWNQGRIKAMVEARLQDLESHLTVLGHSRIFEAGQMGLGARLAHRADSPGVQRLITELQARNDRFLAESLIPDLRKGLFGHVEAKLSVEQLKEGLTKTLGSFRPRVGSYSGGATVAIFEAQKRAGVDENAERVGRGEKPIPVRWVLDPNAEHCENDPSRGTFGCIHLARVYPGGWGEMPTIPAGNVSCLGNCRCHIEADFGNGWERP